MENSICTISIGNFGIDDDYTFFKDGRISRYYDQSYWKQNLQSLINVDDISETKKKKILEKCSVEYLNEINSILYKKNSA